MHLNAFERQPGLVEKMSIPDGFRMAGWIYVLSNEYMPGIYKVGMTRTSPEIRAKELSSSTGVPYPFKVEAAFHCEDPVKVEQDIHEAFADKRVSNSREFFKENLEVLTYECRSFCSAEVNEPVEFLAMEYDVISFERLSNLNLPSLYEDIGINTFGDRLAIAERLIRIGAEAVINNLNKKLISLVFDDGKAYAVREAASCGDQNPKGLEELSL